MAFSGGDKTADLKVRGSCGKRNTGTGIRVKPDPQYFDSATVSVPKLSHALRAKAVLCPGLKVTLTDEKKKEIAEAFKKGSDIEQLSNKYSLAESTVRKHLKFLLGDINLVR